MENVTEEKSLVKIDNSIFARVRRFLTNIFKKKNYNNTELIEEKEEMQEMKNEDVELVKEQEDKENINIELDTDNKNSQTHEEYEGKEELEQKLMNYYASIKTSLKQ